MPINDFKPFAIQSGANVVTQAIYAAANYVGQGFNSGISASNAFNKAFRQATSMGSVVAQTICDVLGVDVLDNGNTGVIETNFLHMIRSPGLYVIDTGAANTLVATLSPAPSSLAAITGMALRIKVAANNTGATTLNLNAFGGIAVTTSALAPLGSGVLTQNGIATLIYDGTQFQKVSG